MINDNDMITYYINRKFYVDLQTTRTDIYDDKAIRFGHFTWLQTHFCVTHSKQFMESTISLTIPLKHAYILTLLQPVRKLKGNVRVEIMDSMTRNAYRCL